MEFARERPRQRLLIAAIVSENGTRKVEIDVGKGIILIDVLIRFLLKGEDRGTRDEGCE
jgi:hypothetical protein